MRRVKAFCSAALVLGLTSCGAQRPLLLDEAVRARPTERLSMQTVEPGALLEIQLTDGRTLIGNLERLEENGITVALVRGPGDPALAPLRASHGSLAIQYGEVRSIQDLRYGVVSRALLATTAAALGLVAIALTVE